MADDTYLVDSQFLDFAAFVRAECIHQLRNAGPYAARGSSSAILERVLSHCFAEPDLADIAAPRCTDLAVIRRALLSEVVYMVFNHTPLTRPDNRDFVAAINWNNVDDSTRRGLQSRYPPEGGSSTARPPIIFSLCEPTASQLERSKAQLQWRWAFEKYMATTRSMEQSPNGWTTWNQYLLKHSKDPAPIGIAWGPQEPKEPPAACYIALDVAAAAQIGLQVPAEGSWGLLDQERFLSPNPLPKSLIDLQTRWGDLRPATEIGRTAGVGVAWTVFMLLRYYGFWGGAAFVSIPHVFGVHATNNTGILSLCTLHPLTARRILWWRHLAEGVFAPLLAEDALLEKEKASRIDAYSRMGHALKTCVAITGWRRTTGRVSDAQTGRLDAVIALGNAFRTCAAFCFAEGLGSLERLEAYLRNDDVVKLGAWIDRDALNSSTMFAHDEAAQDYVALILWAAQIVCLCYELPRLGHRQPNGTTVTIAPSEEGVSRELKCLMDQRLKLSPFTTDSDVALILSAIVLEPIKNAAHYLSNPSNARLLQIKETTPLTVALWCAAADHFTIAIENVVSADSARPSSLYDVAALADSVGVAEFEEAVFASPPGLNHIRILRVPVKIYPWRLARRIDDAIRAMEKRKTL